MRHFESLHKKFNFLQFKKYFFNLFLHFRNIHQIWNTLKEKMQLISDFFLNLKTVKSWLLKCVKRALSENLWMLSIIKGPKHKLNLHGSIFVIFFWSPWGEISLKSSVLVVSEMLRLFVNVLTPDEKYSLSLSVKAGVQRNQLKCNYLQFKKYFFNLFLHFRNIHQIWNTLKEKMQLISDFFLNLKTVKSWLLKCVKRALSENLWMLSIIKGPKHKLNLHGSIFVIFFWSPWGEISLKSSVLVVSEMLRLFVNVLTPDEK